MGYTGAVFRKIFREFFGNYNFCYLFTILDYSAILVKQQVF